MGGLFRGVSFGILEGAKRGYNPTKPGRHSHHPMLAFLEEAPLVLHAWLRSGNTGAARGVTGFLTEALALMPAGWKLRTVRADSGFFENALLTYGFCMQDFYATESAFLAVCFTYVTGAFGWGMLWWQDRSRTEVSSLVRLDSLAFGVAWDGHPGRTSRFHRCDHPVLHHG